MVVSSELWISFELRTCPCWSSWTQILDNGSYLLLVSYGWGALVATGPPIWTLHFVAVHTFNFCFALEFQPFFWSQNRTANGFWITAGGFTVLKLKALYDFPNMTSVFSKMIVQPDCALSFAPLFVLCLTFLWIFYVCSSGALWTDYFLLEFSVYAVMHSEPIERHFAK